MKRVESSHVKWFDDDGEQIAEFSEGQVYFFTKFFSTQQEVADHLGILRDCLHLMEG